MLNIIFMGTPDFSLPSLEAVVNSGNNLLAIITQPDKPKGRGEQFTPPPVKKWGIIKGIPVYQPEKIRGDFKFIDQIRELSPDLIITAAFGQILPKDFLNIPALGCINVHGSLLPKYRGASPIQQALIDGENKTGITVMYMDVGMDTGDVIMKEELLIADNDNAGSLHDRLSILGGEVLSRVITLFESGKPVGIPQERDKATYCSKIEKAMGEINWVKSASAIKYLIRGLTPWPGAFTFHQGQRLKVWKAEEWEYFTSNGYHAGTVLKANTHDGLIVACQQSALRILELQGQGGRTMSAIEYLRGNHIEEGTQL